MSGNRTSLIVLKLVTGMEIVFNTDKCTVMHIGSCNQPGKTYYMESHKLQECHEEKDDLKVGSQCNQAFSKANRMLGVLKRYIVSKTPLIMVNLYKTLV